MATEIKMPQLSDTMDAGKILNWKKKEGDTVSRGEILAEVETDKANLEIECFTPGVLLKQVAPAGHSAKVGEVIAVIGQAGEQVGASSAQAAPAVPEPAAPAAAIKPTAKSEPPPAPAPEQPPKPSSEDRIKASPLAKKLAQEKSIELSSIQGTGPGGRIVRKDIEAAHGPSAREAPQRPSPIQRLHAESTQRSDGGSSTPLSRMRETIARRMQESATQSPHFYTTISIDMEPVSKLRELLKEQDEYKGLSVNHFVIKAAAYALQRQPSVNQAMREGAVYSPAQINIGVVTSVPEGLLIPVLKDTNLLSLKDLVFEARAAIERAKAGRPNATDLTGGTFSISNMGMFDVENFTAIINPGQGAILAVSSAQQVPVVKNGQVAPGLRMKVTLSVDHRVIDGVMAAAWLKEFKSALENPALLFV